MTSTLTRTSWETLPLAEVAEIERNAIAADQITAGSRYVGLEDISSSGQVQNFTEVSPGDIASTKFHFTPEHVLYGKLRPYLSKIALPDFEGICSTDILPVLPGERLDRRFLCYFLRQPHMVEFATRRSTGANLPRLSPTRLAEFEIPLPPLSEQKRIADILDQADAIRRKRQDAINASQEILPSLFADIFGIAGQKYALQSLDEHLEFITSGSRGWAKYYVTKGKRFIRSLDVQMNRIGSDDIAFVDPPSGTEADRTRVADGDVLVTITGSRIGRVAFIPNGFGEAYVSQHVAIARLKPTLRPRYCSLFLSLPNGGQRQIARAQYGQTKPGLSLTNIRGFQIPQAPLAEQDRFLDAWDKFDKKANHFAQALTESDKLFNSLVQRAFKGEL